MFFRLLRHLSVCTALIAVADVHAQGIGIVVPPLSNLQLMSYTAVNNLHLAFNAHTAVTRATQPLPAAASTRISIEPNVTQRTLDKLAAAYPAAQRSTVRTAFGTMLDGYKQLEEKLGIPHDDIAGAIATFIAGSYEAYRDVDLPEEQMLPLVEQIRTAIAGNPGFAKASNTEKQEMYEQMAVLGVFIASTRLALRDHPSAQMSAQMRQAAKGYLEQLLKTDADRIAITARGLVMR